MKNSAEGSIGQANASSGAETEASVNVENHVEMVYLLLRGEREVMVVKEGHHKSLNFLILPVQVTLLVLVTRLIDLPCGICSSSIFECAGDFVR